MPTRIPASILMLASTVPLLWSCGQEQPPAEVDPKVGRDCFELHRPFLPPGTQYEGFDVAGAQVTVKVMDGVRLTTVDCTLSPDGTLKSERDRAE
jgi:hypothetical protein